MEPRCRKQRGSWQPATGHHASKLVLTCHDQLLLSSPPPVAGMTVHGETVLRQRVCRGSGCHAVFWICQHCDRGQGYCSPACRAQARLQQRRCANCRHQRSREGRLDHRDRQRAYRRRQAHARVTDQGSLSISPPAICGCGNSRSTRIATPAGSAAAFLPCWSQKGPERWRRCIVCGGSGWVVESFPRFP
jgi:hypothetical protein